MSDFENVSVQKHANIYFDGAVSSRTIRFANGEMKTLGIMLPGEYTFSTDQREIMELLSGELEVLLPGASEWQGFTAGQSFEVSANASFQVKALKLVDYCCSFIRR